MPEENLGKSIISTISLIAGSLILEGLMLIILQIALHNHMSMEINIVTIAVAIIFASILYPYFLLKRIYSASWKDLGVQYQPILSTCLLVGSAVYLGTTLIFSDFSMVVILVIIQNIFVAIGEEFVARGCLFYLLRKMTGNEILTILISTIIFVFVFHSNSTLTDNLLWRLPVTVLLGIIYSNTNSIVNCSVLHMTYNVIVSI